MLLQLSDAFNTFLTDVSDLENQTLNFQYGKIEKLKFWDSNNSTNFKH